MENQSYRFMALSLTLVLFTSWFAGVGTANASSIALQNPGFNATENVTGNSPLGSNNFTTGAGFGSAVPVSVSPGGGSSSSVPATYTANTLAGWASGGGSVGISNADSSYFAAGGNPASGPYAYVGAGGLIYETLTGVSFAANTNYSLGVDVIRTILAPNTAAARWSSRPCSRSSSPCTPGPAFHARRCSEPPSS